MIPVGPLLRSYQLTAAAVRKARGRRTFNREKASVPLRRETLAFWSGLDDRLFAWLDENEGWATIARHTGTAVQKAEFGKALSEQDKRFIAELFLRFGGYLNAEEVARRILEATSIPTYEAAGQFALGQIGVANAVFELRNETIRDRILNRAQTLNYASTRHGSDTLETIVRNFYDLGRNPYDANFVRELKHTIQVKTEWEARRFALTETGIVAEIAQHDTFRRNGVGRKRWNIRGINTRPDHQDLEGVEVMISESFDVGGSMAEHPLDPDLPPDQLVNCRCYLTPVVDETFEIDPRRVWEGE